MQAVTELSDWIWMIVAGIWVVTRILPRLFRSGSRKSRPTTAETRDKVEMPRATPGGVPTQLPMGRSKGGAPPPIEPS